MCVLQGAQTRAASARKTSTYNVRTRRAAGALRTPLNEKRKMVPPRGIEPRSAVYKTAASPQCFKGRQKCANGRAPAEHPRQGRRLHGRPSKFWTFTISNSPRPRPQKFSRRARWRRAPSAAPKQSAHSARQGTNGKGQTARVARKRASPAAVLSILPLNPGHFALLPFGGGSGWPAAAYPGFLNPGSGCFAARCWEPPFATHERPQSLSRFHGCAAAVRANEYERIEVIGSSRSCGHRKRAGRALVPQNR